MEEAVFTTVPETITFAKKITVEEYDKQKDVFTKKALKELNDQMKQLPSIIKKSNNKLSMSLPNSDNDEQEEDNSGNPALKTDFENDNSESDYNDNDNDETTKGNPSLNFIIKHYVSENSQHSQQSIKKRKTTQNNTQNNSNTNKTNTMTDAIYAQHEVDMNTITKLKLQNNTLKVENEDLDKKKHFLTLELSNAQCDVDDLKKQLSYLKNENINLKQFIKIMKKSDEQFEKYVKSTCYIVTFLIILMCYMFL